MAIGERYRAYPPNGRLLVPSSLGRAAAAAVATTMACRPAAVALHHLVYAGVRIGGARALLSPSKPLADPATEQDLAELRDAVSADIGRIDSIAILMRRQQLRDGLLGLAFRDAEPIAFIKAAPAHSAAGLEVERVCLDVLADDPDAPVFVPKLLASGATDEFRWNAIAPLPPRPHRPAYTCDAATIAGWIQQRLSSVRTTLPTGLPTHAEVPSHWRPMHGDFAPWNLRKIFRGPTALFDLEDARLAPPDADMTYWIATSAVLRGRRVTDALEPEARNYWIDRVTTRLAAGVDPTADRRLLETLNLGGR